MSHPSKRKGTGFERELVEQAKAAGLPAKRAWGSDGRSMGEAPDVDIVVAGERFQCKRRASLPRYLQISPNCRGHIYRADHGEAVVVIPWRVYLDMEANRDYSC
jgi:Holliday junction resolvase